MKYNLDCAVWELTLECNLKCKHCGSSAGKARKNELTTQECFNLCEDLSEVGCREVSLMGGEPFVREDWNEIAWCVKDLGMDLAFVSNGILIPQVIEKLNLLEPVVVGVSLDGVKETHDYIRRKGSYDAAHQAIELLLENDIQTTVITTISKTNFKELLELKKLIYGKGINWQIQVCMPFGYFDPSLVISQEEYYASAMFIVSERIKNKFKDMPVVGAHCYGYFSHLLPRNNRWDGCTAGRSTVGLTSEGSVVGCLSMGNNQFIEGNVRDRSFKEIWEDPNSFAYNRNFKRDDFGENCIDCFYGEKCKGGCNSTSYHLTKKFHNTPLCLRKIEEKLFDVKIPKKERSNVQEVKSL
ncbi:MAG: radical SAM protein [Asgard group archaeon]|nr:radical SAM protein [Asgard group archaeon]